MNKDFAQRMKRAMFLRGIRQADLVERTGIDKGSLSSYMNGRYMPNAEKISLIAKALGVSVDYLLGKEEFKYSDLLPAPVMVRESYLTDEEHDLLEAWKKADEKQKAIVRLALNMPEKAPIRPVERF